MSAPNPPIQIINVVPVVNNLLLKVQKTGENSKFIKSPFWDMDVLTNRFKRKGPVQKIKMIQEASPLTPKTRPLWDQV